MVRAELARAACLRPKHNSLWCESLFRILTRCRQDSSEFCFNLLHSFLQRSFLAGKLGQSTFCNWITRIKYQWWLMRITPNSTGTPSAEDLHSSIIWADGTEMNILPTALNVAVPSGSFSSSKRVSLFRFLSMSACESFDDVIISCFLYSAYFPCNVSKTWEIMHNQFCESININRR